MALEDWSQSIVATPGASAGKRRARPSPPVNLIVPILGEGPGVRAVPLNAPRRIEVEADAVTGAPALLRRGGREQRVRSVQNHWRIDDEWWREPISRHYYQLELAGGALLTVFRDLVAGGWWEQRA